MKSLSRVQLFATPWTVAYQAPPSMGFSRQEYWSGLPFPSPGDLPNPGIEPGSPTLQADALPSEPPGKPRWALNQLNEGEKNVEEKTESKIIFHKVLHLKCSDSLVCNNLREKEGQVRNFAWGGEKLKYIHRLKI